MIRVRHVDLSLETKATLETWQDEIDALPTHRERASAAIAGWKAKRGLAPFRVVEETLDAMCSPPRRCMYCEDNGAHQIEHFRPKSLYPRLVFDWTNYLYACGRCNTAKLDRFALFSPTNTVIELRDADEEPDREPSVLLNPRCDDPMNFLKLDLREPFYFRTIHPEGSTEHHRAALTLRWLGLNLRDDLVEARSRAYEAYVSHLHRYADLKRRGVPREELARMERTIRRTPHATVLREMQRQWKGIAELRILFAEAPEALSF